MNEQINQHKQSSIRGIARRYSLALALIVSLGGPVWPARAEGGSSEGPPKEEVVKGPHRGRMLRGGDFAIEVTIFETGIPPEFRVYATKNGSPVPPSQVELTVTLNRLGGRTDHLRFTPENDYLVSDGVVVEPHSFDVTLTAAHAGERHSWQYSSYEGRTELTARAITAAGIEYAQAGPQTIADEILLTGTIEPSEHRVAHVIPRFAGVVREGRKHLGDSVERGEVVAVIESNQSLQPYEVRSPIGGTILSGHLVPGEYVGENQTAFVVADIAEVWADFRVFPGDAGKVRPGQSLRIRSGASEEPILATVWYVSSYADEVTQSRYVRAVVPNGQRRLYPGMFATASLEVEPKQVPVAVKTSALQTYRDWTAVFIADGTKFEVQPLELGKANEEWTEVVSGLAAGQRYVTGNSFLIKADILKSGATHDH